MSLAIEEQAHDLIVKAVSQGVSDIHLMPKPDHYVLYFRLNGLLHEKGRQDLEWGKRLINYFKYRADMDVGEKRKPQSGASHLELDGQAVELRFSTIGDVHLQESLVIRVIQSQARQGGPLLTYFPKDLDILRRLIRRKSGLILFSGPVGSGKTTTIYHLLRERLQEEFIQVITMEDPVEIFEPRFLQTQINEAAGISYDVMIKASLRHHPDVLMIGEIRDEETARMVIRGALTGHLMIATVHAKDSLGVMARLAELSISQAQLTQTLIGIVSQRLIPRYCSLCQASCQLACQHHPVGAKRLALLEILSGQALRQHLTQELAQPAYQTLNDMLRKAWSYGFIDGKTYLQFEVV